MESRYNIVFFSFFLFWGGGGGTYSLTYRGLKRSFEVKGGLKGQCVNNLSAVVGNRVVVREQTGVELLVKNITVLLPSLHWLRHLTLLYYYMLLWKATNDALYDKLYHDTKIRNSLQMSQPLHNQKPEKKNPNKANWKVTNCIVAGSVRFAQQARLPRFFPVLETIVEWIREYGWNNLVVTVRSKRALKRMSEAISWVKASSAAILIALCESELQGISMFNRTTSYISTCCIIFSSIHYEIISPVK